MSRSRSPVGPLALALGVAAAISVWRRWVDVVEVRGRSMAPTLLPGDRLLVTRLAGDPAAGEVVLAPDPRAPHRELVKRVAEIEGGRVILRGDNPRASTDARTFGDLEASAIRWRVALRYWPPDRIGLVPRRSPDVDLATGGVD